MTITNITVFQYTGATPVDEIDIVSAEESGYLQVLLSAQIDENVGSILQGNDLGSVSAGELHISRKVLSDYEEKITHDGGNKGLVRLSYRGKPHESETVIGPGVTKGFQGEGEYKNRFLIVNHGALIEPLPRRIIEG